MPKPRYYLVLWHSFSIGKLRSNRDMIKMLLILSKETTRKKLWKWEVRQHFLRTFALQSINHNNNTERAYVQSAALWASQQGPLKCGGSINWKIGAENRSAPPDRGMSLFCRFKSAFYEKLEIRRKSQHHKFEPPSTLIRFPLCLVLWRTFSVAEAKLYCRNQKHITEQSTSRWINDCFSVCLNENTGNIQVFQIIEGQKIFETQPWIVAIKTFYGCLSVAFTKFSSGSCFRLKFWLPWMW